MPSATKTGTCLRPSCTAIVCPSIAGTTIVRRDQVLMTFLVPLSFWVMTFFIKWSSTKGPFFTLLGIVAPNASGRDDDGGRSSCRLVYGRAAFFLLACPMG